MSLSQVLTVPMQLHTHTYTHICIHTHAHCFLPVHKSQHSQDKECDTENRQGAEESCELGLITTKVPEEPWVEVVLGMEAVGVD